MFCSTRSLLEQRSIWPPLLPLLFDEKRFVSRGEKCSRPPRGADVYMLFFYKALHTATHDTHLPRLSFSSDEPHREFATLKASTPNLILYIPVGHLEHTDSKMTKHYGSSRP